MPGSRVYEKLNTAWKHTSRILFGEELGELSEYERWLSSLSEPLAKKKSSVSGKEVAYYSNYYCPRSKRAALGEVGRNTKFEPLSINEIKDVDSIVQALQDRIYYTGNIVLGNSDFVEASTNITDSFYILDSAVIADSKYLAFCNNVRYCNNLFGCSTGGQSEFSIRIVELYENTRCFETWTSDSCTDLYYCNDMQGCADCMFSFNQLGKRRLIGNRELPKDKYLKIKKHILEQLSAELSKKKKLPSLVEIVRNSRKSNAEFSGVEIKEKEHDFSQIESAFASTTKTLFGKTLSGIKDYAPWLSGHVREMGEGVSSVSGRKVLLVNYSVTEDYSEERLVKFDEKKYVQDLKISEEDIEHFDYYTAPGYIGKIDYMCSEIDIQNINGAESPTSAYSMHFFRCSLPAHAKYCAYTFWPRNSQFIFGSNTVFDCSSSVKCSQSKQLSRCFEADCCTSSSDLYFSHNCENVNTSMFCFNVKNLKRAIGNAEYSPDEYKKVKSSLLEQVVSELEEKKTFKWDIYNIGCK